MTCRSLGGGPGGESAPLHCNCVTEGVSVRALLVPREEESRSTVKSPCFCVRVGVARPRHSSPKHPRHLAGEGAQVGVRGRVGRGGMGRGLRAEPERRAGIRRQSPLCPPSLSPSSSVMTQQTSGSVLMAWQGLRASRQHTQTGRFEERPVKRFFSKVTAAAVCSTARPDGVREERAT